MEPGELKVGVERLRLRAMVLYDMLLSIPACRDVSNGFEWEFCKAELKDEVEMK